MALFLHFGLSKPLKQPKTPQILSQNRAKTTGSNDLGSMLNNFSKDKSPKTPGNPEEALRIPKGVRVTTIGQTDCVRVTEPAAERLTAMLNGRSVQ